MTADLRGAAKESTDVEPIGRNKVERDAMYTPNEKKRLKPDKKSQDMYAVNNNESKKVVDRLIDLAHELQPCDLTADSLYDSILYQVSHKKDRSIQILSFTETNSLLFSEVSRSVPCTNKETYFRN